MNRNRDWQLCFIIILGALLRLLFLSIKAPHFDEGINGWFVDQLISRGYYDYDPTNYHGPLHFYFMFFFKILFGRNLWALRLPSVIMGIGAIYLVARFRDYFGKPTAYLAALMVALSPGMIFYSRYAIHEADLLVFSLLALHGYFRLVTKNDKTSLWLLSVGIAGMLTTKETYIAHFLVFLISIYCLRFYQILKPSTEMPLQAEPGYGARDILAAFGTCIFLVVIFYTGFFQDASGITDFFNSLAPWFKTGKEGQGHGKEFLYWVKLMLDYEWPSLLGLIVLPVLLFSAPYFVRLVGIYGLGVLLAYSIVPYKTPWCIIQILWPFTIVAAAVLAGYWNQKVRWYLGVAALIPLAHSTYKAIDLNFRKPTDEQEKYVYVQTFNDILKFDDYIKKAIQADISKKHMGIQILMQDHWPLPWLFGDYTKVGFFSNIVPNNPDGAVIFINSDQRMIVEGRLKKSYFVIPFRLRSAQQPGLAYFDTEIFKDVVDPSSEMFIPRPPASPKAGEGLLSSYYANALWTGRPVVIKKVSNPSFEFELADRPLPAPFSISFKGEILIPQSGTVTFYLASDDGSSLSINGKQIIDNLGSHALREVESAHYFKQGWYPIEVKYNDFGGGMALRLMWRLPNLDKSEIEAKYLKTGQMR